MISNFAKMISELGDILQIPLQVEQDVLCVLKINNSIQIQIEDDPTQHRILILAVICPIPPGKFRENVLREGLKVNFHYPRIGTFSYMEKNDMLCLHNYFYHVEMTGLMMAQALADFIEVSNVYYQAIQSGRVPTA